MGERELVPSLAVVEAGFGVAFMAGEFVCGGAAAADLFAVGQVVHRVLHRLIQFGEHARRAQVILVREVGCRVFVSGHHLSSQIDVAHGPDVGLVLLDAHFADIGEV